LDTSTAIENSEFISERPKWPSGNPDVGRVAQEITKMFTTWSKDDLQSDADAKNWKSYCRKQQRQGKEEMKDIWKRDIDDRALRDRICERLKGKSCILSLSSLMSE
jgi:hypothetical protein